MRLVGFPARTPGCVPAPQTRPERFGIGFGFVPHGAGFTGKFFFFGGLRFVTQVNLLFWQSQNAIRTWSIGWLVTDQQTNHQTIE
jgi:hypothetical protein